MTDFKGAKKYILDRLEAELSSNLLYHGVHHTIDVYEVSIKIAELEGISQEDKLIVNTAALYHDSGFLYRYEDNESLSVNLIREILPQYGYNSEQILGISEVIISTQQASRPVTLLEKIMSDADYDYLGRKDVVEIANFLYQELNHNGYSFSITEWNKMQLKFLEKHVYYTPSSIVLRRPNKLAYYERIKRLK